MKNPWKDDIIRLSKFLKKHFPEEVEKNMGKSIEESSAVDLAIEILFVYWQLQK